MHCAMKDLPIVDEYALTIDVVNRNIAAAPAR
jgi:hypothetical protein